MELTNLLLTRYHQNMTRKKLENRAPGKLCEVDACDRTVFSKGYCKTHAQRIRFHGDPQAHIPLRNPRVFCSEDGCVDDMTARGLCKFHNRRLDGTNLAIRRKIEYLESIGYVVTKV